MNNLTDPDNIRVILGLSMLLMHIIADFYLLNILSDFKPKQWWEDNYPDKKYTNDYIETLFMHSMEWSILVHIPMIIFAFIFEIDMAVIVRIISIQGIIRGIIDHYKWCNKLKINLSTDQFFHMVQLFLSIYIFIYYIM